MLELTLQLTLCANPSQTPQNPTKQIQQMKQSPVASIRRKSSPESLLEP